jgi:hypothetical protein
MTRKDEGITTTDNLAPDQDEAPQEEKPTTLTGPGGTKVTASGDALLEALKASGYK